ncbi:MAG: VCBS repeat-containing protein [Gemmatimonadetes bacterium]|nr:VCBS repeat-containing protein [Gemmatimonadota bacterium]
MSRRHTLAVCAALLPAMLGAQGGAAFARKIAPFPVADRAGTPIAEPFLGGLDVPRPQLVDIDGDGDLDLFLQERADALMFFENVKGKLQWRTDQYGGMAVGEWARFVDLDQDGVIDLLTEMPNSYIRLWRNVGTKTAAQFEAAADSLRDSEGQPIFADRQNILNLVDLNCNGRLDLFIGRVSGTIVHYEAEVATKGSIPRFRMLTERFEEIEIVGTGSDGTRPSLHGANTMAFGDVDGDGDPDLLWGDFFEPGLLLIANQGSCAQPDLRHPPAQFPVTPPLLTSGYNAPSLGDFDGDGDLDLVMGVIGGAFGPNRTSIDNLYLVEQVKRGEWSTRTSRLLPMLDVGSESVPTLADLDGDGDLDLLVGNRIVQGEGERGTLTWLENVGSRTAPSFRDRGPLGLPTEFNPTAAVADLDGDGLPDLVVGTWRDRVQWFRNSGTKSAPTWTLADSALIVLTRGSNSVPALADLDGDGDLDMMVGEASGQLNLYRNVGSRTAPKFELVSDNFQGIDVGRRASPTFADPERTGRPDLFLGSDDGGLQRWRNVSAGNEIRFVLDSNYTVATHRGSAATFGDLYGSGVLALLVGDVSGGLLYFERPR